MKSRFWSIDDKGYLLNDADWDKIDPLYHSLIERVVRAYLPYNPHSIYLTGSISRGIAVPYQSDLDAFAVAHPGKGEHCSIPMSLEDSAVSDIQLEVWPWEYVFPEDRAFSIGAFIIKTHSVCLYGKDLGEGIAPYTLTSEIAKDDLRHIDSDIKEALKAIRLTSSQESIRYWCKRIMKNIIRTGFSLVMLEEGCFTRDLDLCCSVFIRHYPQQKKQMKRALLWAKNPTASIEVIEAFLRDFGHWLMQKASET